MNILGVCGGNGVMLHPLKEHLIANVEPRAVFHSKGEHQWKANFGDIPLHKELPKLKEKVDVIIGHPDCGHSSVLSYSRKKTLGKPKDNKSLTMFIKAVELYDPLVFILENLPALLKHYDKAEFASLFFRYKLKFIEGSVTIFGNSQVNRERLIIVGYREDMPRKGFMLPVLDFKPKTTKELIGDLGSGNKPEIGHIREPYNTEFTIYARKKISIAEAQKHWLDNPDASRWGVKDRNFTTAPGVYRNLANKPPNTVRKGNREFNHKGFMMSPRERARIQGIPDNFIIYVNPKEQGYWINKGRITVTKCPPYEISLWIKQTLTKYIKKHG